MKERGLTELNKVIILRNEKMEFGVVADSIIGNTTFLLQSLCEPPFTFGLKEAGFISGVTPDGLILLNAFGLLSSKQLIIKN
jgi:purine-binding chemotaxis protein CheW